MGSTQFGNFHVSELRCNRIQRRVYELVLTIWNRISVATRLYQSATFVSQPARSSNSTMLILPSQQLFPGFKYNDSNLKSCILEGIPLKNGNHLGNLGSLQWTDLWRNGLTLNRLNSPLRYRNCSHWLPSMEIRTKTSSGGTEVCWISSLALEHALTSASREMQIFLIGYIIIEICEIFTVGDFPLSNTVRIVSSLVFKLWKQADRNRPSLVFTSA